MTHERLLELLYYEPDTGVFTWKINRAGTAKAGRVAGTKHVKNYLQIRVQGRVYRAHRLAWFYVYGVWPAADIDHINGLRDDNRIANLRQATSAENHQNRKKYNTNTSGHTGVYWEKCASKWRARLMINGKYLHLGMFDSIEAAIAARITAKSTYHTFNPYDRGENYG